MSDDATFTLDIGVNGPGIEPAAKSLETLDVALQAASKASAAASDAVKAGEAIYNRQQAAADSAAKALERVGIAADVQRTKLAAANAAGDSKGVADATAKLQDLAAQQTVLSARADAAAASLTKEAQILDKLKASSAAAEAAEEKLAAEMAAAQKAQDAASQAETHGGEEGGISFEKLERGANKLGGPLGGLIGKVAGVGSGFSKLTKSLGDAAPYAIAAIGLAAVAAGLVAVAAKAIEALAKIVEFAVGLADANRTALLLSQGIARSVAGGAALNGQIGQLVKTLPLTREELSGMAQKLADSGLRGKDLTAALDKAAIAAAKLKFGPDFAKEMLSLDEQSKVFQANIAEVFGGLKTDALMGGLQKLIALFDANTASGKAMKVLFESIFQPLVDWIAKQAPKIERFFLQFEIWIMKAMIKIKPYGSVIEKVFLAIGIAIGIVVAVVVLFVAGIVMAVGAVLALVGAVVLAAVWIGEKFGAAIKAIAGFFQSLDIGGLAKGLIDGLVNGLKNGATAVVNAIKGVVTGAIDAAKSLLGIASPSKVFAEIGLQTGAGMSKGVDKSAGGVQDSLEDMVSPPAGKPGKGGPAATGAGAHGGKGGHTITVQIYGVAGAEDAIEKMSEALTRILEGDAAQLGAVSPV